MHRMRGREAKEEGGGERPSEGRTGCPGPRSKYPQRSSQDRRTRQAGDLCAGCSCGPDGRTETKSQSARLPKSGYSHDIFSSLATV